MRFLISFVTIFFATQLFADNNYPYPFRNPNLSIEERVEDLVSRLTPEEKIAQMVNAAAGIPRLGIPPYEWWSVALHGVSRAGQATMFPQAIAMGATFDQEAMLESFTMISDEARAKYNDAQAKQNYGRYYGLTFWTPSVDLFRDPRWGRGMETYGEDPYLITRFGVAAVKGLQGEDPQYFKLHAGAKHYAVHSGPEWNRHSFDVKVSDYDLYETYLYPFKALIQEADVQEIMAAYNRYDGVPCSCNEFLLRDILREKWGYEALIFAECGGIVDFWKKGHHETHDNAVDASIASIKAGVDYECGTQFLTLIPGLKDGSIDPTILDESIRRVMKSRIELGMFDPEEMVPFSKIGMDVVECDKHLAQALEMAQKSIVLLENKKKILPLDRNIKHIAVVGPNADDEQMLWGNYSGTPSQTTTILEGIKAKFPNSEITYIKGCDHIDPILEPQEVVDGVASADVIIFVGGISPRLEGEQMKVEHEGFKGGDRTNIEVPQVQRDLFLALAQTNIPIVYVSCSGSAIAYTKESELSAALIQAWYGGQTAGDALADILVGDYNPSGRLPLTFYKSIDDLPDYEDYSMEGRTYRYFMGEPLYAFGYGLSYTSFKFGKLSVVESSVKVGESVTIDFNLKNNGKRDGEEVVQVYIKRLAEKGGAIKSLKSFKRVPLMAGESTKVSITLAADAFEGFDEQSQDMAVLSGDYAIWVGSSSLEADLKRVVVTLE